MGRFTPSQNEEIMLTHRAWCLLCPIYMSDSDGAEEGPVHILARRPWLEPWLMANVSVSRAIAWLLSVFGFDSKVAPFLITGKLDAPLTLRSKEEWRV